MKPTGNTSADADLQRLTWYFLGFLDNYVYQTQRDSEFVLIYAMVGHPELDPDNAEVSEGKWWTMDEIDAAIGKGVLTPNFESEFSRIRASLQALL